MKSASIFALSAFLAMNAAQATEHANGLIHDHATTIEQCGVGNYLFRGEATCAGKVAVNEVSEKQADDEMKTAQSSAVTAAAVAPISATLYFDTASARLTPASSEKVAEIMKSLKANGAGADHLVIETIGYADSRGSETYNQKLSEARALATAKAFGKTLKTAKIETQGRGESAPAVADSTSWENRRVEISIRSAE